MFVSGFTFIEKLQKNLCWQQKRLGRRFWFMVFRQQTCSWLWSRSLWPCRHATGIQWSLLVERLISLYTHAYRGRERRKTCKALSNCTQENISKPSYVTNATRSPTETAYMLNHLYSPSVAQWFVWGCLLMLYLQTYFAQQGFPAQHWNTEEYQGQGWGKKKYGSFLFLLCTSRKKKKSLSLCSVTISSKSQHWQLHRVWAKREIISLWPKSILKYSFTNSSTRGLLLRQSHVLFDVDSKGWLILKFYS